MNYRSNKYISRFIISFGMILMHYVQIEVYAQTGSEKNQTFINVDFNQSDTHKKLIATLTARIKGERGRIRMESAEIEFYNMIDTTKIILGKATTDKEGVAVFEIGMEQNITTSPENGYEFAALFKGNENYSEASKSGVFKLIKMDISFAEIDSVKTIVASAYQIEGLEEYAPVKATVRFYVPGQFSMLEIGKEKFQDGRASVEFPENLPGDSNGNLKIIVAIENSKRYGTVEASGIKNWGKPRPPVVIEKRRGLGDTDAPLWMVYTLIILLSAVWFHYMYIIYVFITIKRKGNIRSLTK